MIHLMISCCYLENAFANANIKRNSELMMENMDLLFEKQ